MELVTGGIETEVVVTPNLKNPNQYQLSIMINSYCLEKNYEKMIDLIEMIHLDSKVASNPTYLKSLIEQFLFEISSEMITNGTSFASLYSFSRLTKSDVKKLF
jgi:pentatricopeptide repeat protein